MGLWIGGRSWGKGLHSPESLSHPVFVLFLNLRNQLGVLSHGGFWLRMAHPLGYCDDVHTQLGYQVRTKEPPQVMGGHALYLQSVSNWIEDPVPVILRLKPRANIDTELLVGLKFTGQTTRKYLAVSGQSLYSYFIVTTTSGIIIYFDIV